MACSTRRKTQKAPQFSIVRMQTCASCQHNVDGVCSLVKELKQGNLQKDALIEVGVLMPDAWCPIGKWGQHRSDPVGPGERRKCQWCGRLHDKPQEVCPWCQAKMGMQLRNMQKGIGGRAWGDPFDERLHDVRMRPFTGEVIKHLHFFLYPRFADNTDYHLSKLEELYLTAPKALLLQLTVRHVKNNSTIELTDYLMSLMSLKTIRLGVS
jgi:hypothetical protein